jgi:hypothetical protein
MVYGVVRCNTESSLKHKDIRFKKWSVHLFPSFLLDSPFFGSTVLPLHLQGFQVPSSNQPASFTWLRNLERKRAKETWEEPPMMTWKREAWSWDWAWEQTRTTTATPHLPDGAQRAGYWQQRTSLPQSLVAHVPHVLLRLRLRLGHPPCPLPPYGPWMRIRVRTW